MSQDAIDRPAAEAAVVVVEHDTASPGRSAIGFICAGDRPQGNVLTGRVVRQRLAADGLPRRAESKQSPSARGRPRPARPP
jgi:hypothetical protein